MKTVPLSALSGAPKLPKRGKKLVPLSGLLKLKK